LNNKQESELLFDILREKTLSLKAYQGYQETDKVASKPTIKLKK